MKKRSLALSRCSQLGLAAFLLRRQNKTGASSRKHFNGESVCRQKIAAPDIRLIAEDLDIPWEVFLSWR
jgi:hypothetical protein